VRLHTILSAALRSRLVHQIQKALHTEKDIVRKETTEQLMTLAEELLCIPDDLSGNASLPQQKGKTQTLPLKQIRQSERKQLEYVSAVALKYAQSLQQPPLQFAQNLMEKLNETAKNPNAKLRETPFDGTTLDSIQQYFDLEAVPPGWIFFRLTAPGLAVWLQFLIDRPLPIANHTPKTPLESRPLIRAAASARNSTSVFPILHTYARCHSMLRLGQQMSLVQMSLAQTMDRNAPIAPTKPSAEYSEWRIQAPHPFPWLQSNGSFRGNEPLEWQLVEQICATLDELAQLEGVPDRSKTLKQADRLSQSWQRFNAQCRIADEVKQNDPAQAQFRLGLTCITQRLLHALLRSIELPTPLFL